MNIEYDSINVDLYIVAVAFGKNYGGNNYGRILVSDNMYAKGSEYSRPINYDDIYYNDGILEDAEFSQDIPSVNNIPRFRKVVSLKEAIYWGKGNLIHISHAAIGVKNNNNTITIIRDTYTAALNYEEDDDMIDTELYSLFNRKGAVYYKNKEFLNDYKRYLCIQKNK